MLIIHSLEIRSSNLILGRVLVKILTTSEFVGIYTNLSIPSSEMMIQLNMLGVIMMH